DDTMHADTHTSGRPPRLTVVGTGYLGATHAVCMATPGYQVLGADVDAAKVEALVAGRVPFNEPGLPQAPDEDLASGRLDFTTDFAPAADLGDIPFLCVGTTQQPGSHAAKQRFVVEAAAQLAARITRPALIVGKSTVPVGTAAR